MKRDTDRYYGDPTIHPHRNGILCTDPEVLARLQQAEPPAIEMDIAVSQAEQNWVQKAWHVGQAAVERIRTLHLV